MRRGVSHIVAVVLTILIAVLAAVSLYFMVHHFSHTSAVFASASLAGVRWINGRPTYTIDLVLASKHDTRLAVANITVVILDKNGNVYRDTFVSIPVAQGGAGSSNSNPGNQGGGYMVTQGPSEAGSGSGHAVELAAVYIGNGPVNGVPAGNNWMLITSDPTLAVKGAVDPDAIIYVYPHKTQHVTLVLVAQDNIVPVQATFIVTLVDDAGNVYTAQTASISL